MDKAAFSQESIMRGVAESNLPIILCNGQLETIAYSVHFCKTLRLAGEITLKDFVPAEGMRKIVAAQKTVKPVSIKCHTKKTDCILKGSWFFAQPYEPPFLLGMLTSPVNSPEQENHIAIAYSCLNQSVMPLQLLLNGITLTKQYHTAGKSEDLARIIGEMETHSIRLLRHHLKLHNCIGILTESFNLTYETMDLAILVKTIVRETRKFTAQKDIKISLKLPELPVLVRCDSKHMTQTIANCLRTCADFAIKTTKLSVELKAEPSHAIISILDPVSGVPECHRDSIFHQDLVMDDGVQKIGLYFPYAIINKHGGSIKINPQKPFGTQTQISIPLAPSGRVTLRERNIKQFEQEIAYLVKMEFTDF